jgi:AcrR family transcriptional regulator
VSHADPLVARVQATDDDGDEVTRRILDAALEQFELFGLRRSTVEDVAKRAGLARVTIYRRFPTKHDLMVAVIVREARRAFAEVDAAVSRVDGVEQRIVEGFVATLTLARHHPLLRRLLSTEPEVVLPYFTLQGGPVLAAARTYLADHIRRAQRHGDVPRFDPEPVAEMLVRVAQSFLLTPESVIPIDNDRKVRAFARAYLAPIVTGASPRHSR